jgi:acyl carrier protein
VEPSEIETSLLLIECISQCAVIYAHEMIVAFITLTNVSSDPFGENGALTIGLRKLKSDLPRWMVPNKVIVLDFMPTNLHEKIDYLQLEKTFTNSSEKENSQKNESRKNNLKQQRSIESSPFWGSLGSRILMQWKNILNNNEITIDDDFFENGGNSIKIIQFISSLHSTENIIINSEAIYHYPTIRKLCDNHPNLQIEQINLNEYENCQGKTVDELSTLAIWDADNRLSDDVLPSEREIDNSYCILITGVTGIYFLYSILLIVNVE